jgi:hypothetical protein
MAYFKVIYGWSREKRKQNTRNRRQGTWRCHRKLKRVFFESNSDVLLWIVIFSFQLRLLETHCTTWKISWESRRALSVFEDLPHIIILYVQHREAAAYWFTCSVFALYWLNVTPSFRIALCVCSNASEADAVNEGHKHETWRYSSTHLAFVTYIQLRHRLVRHICDKTDELKFGVHRNQDFYLTVTNAAEILPTAFPSSRLQ